MAEFHLPEFDESIKRFGRTVDDALANLRDFRAALERSELPEQIIDEYESRGLPRALNDDDAIQ